MCTCPASPEEEVLHIGLPAVSHVTYLTVAWKNQEVLWTFMGKKLPLVLGTAHDKNVGILTLPTSQIQRTELKMVGHIHHAFGNVYRRLDLLTPTLIVMKPSLYPNQEFTFLSIPRVFVKNLGTLTENTFKTKYFFCKAGKAERIDSLVWRSRIVNYLKRCVLYIWGKDLIKWKFLFSFFYFQYIKFTHKNILKMYNFSFLTKYNKT